MRRREGNGETRPPPPRDAGRISSYQVALYRWLMMSLAMVPQAQRLEIPGLMEFRDSCASGSLRSPVVNLRRSSKAARMLTDGVSLEVSSHRLPLVRKLGLTCLESGRRLWKGAPSIKGVLG